MGSGRVSKKWDLGEYRKVGIRVSTENVGSGRVIEKGSVEYWKGGIRESTEKVGFGRVLEKMGSRRVPKRWDPGEYRRRVRESTRNEGSG